MTLFLLLVACPADSPESKPAPEPDQTTESTAPVDDTAPPADDSTAPPCTAVVTGVSPADGSLDVSTDSVITATFSEPVTQAQFLVEPLVTGATALAPDGLSATLTPDAPLADAQDYRVAATACSSTLETTFRTRLSWEVDVVDRAYVVDLEGSDILWVEPPGIGPLFLAYLVTDALIMQVEGVESGMIDAVGTAAVKEGSDFRQYVCTAAINFPPISFSSAPAYEVGPTDTILTINGADIPLYETKIAGTFNEDGSAVDNLVVTGLMDSAPIAAMAGLDLCTFVECTACPDGSDKCVYLEVLDARAPWDPDVQVDPYVDPADYPSCR